MENHNSPPPSHPAAATALAKVLTRISGRATLILQTLLPFSLFGLASTATTNNNNNNPSPDNSTLNLTHYAPHPSSDPQVLTDILFITNLFDFAAYRQIGSAIRSGNRDQCAGNLSIVLDSLGPITAASAGGSSGALTLLPTAGALIGTPAKELWILYKLVPVAGVLSMLLSLGGNIVPSAGDDYEHEGYTYGGVIGTTDAAHEGQARLLSLKGVDAATFAQVVKARAENPLGGSKKRTAVIGVTCQLFWIGIVVFACWFTETGAVVVWWCQGWGWMLFWYVMVAGSSLLENVALVPFTRQWTIRVSTAPRGVGISDDAPSVFSLMGHGGGDALSGDGRMESGGLSGEHMRTAFPGNGRPREVEIDAVHVPRFTRVETDKTTRSVVEEYRNYAPQLTHHRSNFLHNLDKHGFNTIGQAYIDGNQPWAVSRNSFLVILSVSGVSHSHAALRVVSKAVSVACFAAGTATFASASLITISVAVTALCLILSAGMFGRVASMWMVAEMMKENPVLHKVVHSEIEADKYMQKLLGVEGLIFEFMGHVFINGKCVRRYNRWFNWATVFGILKAPYRVDQRIMSVGAGHDSV